MEIITAFSAHKFVPSGYFAFDAALDQINYDPEQLETDIGRLSLLHETSHALLGHFHYTSDYELLLMEIDAWAKTRELAQDLGMVVDEDYIIECLESYDDWLTARSTCPSCANFSLQSNPNQYRCFACGTRWSVNDRKDCRVLRRVIPEAEKTTG